MLRLTPAWSSEPGLGQLNQGATRCISHGDKASRVCRKPGSRQRSQYLTQGLSLNVGNLSRNLTAGPHHLPQTPSKNTKSGVSLPKTQQNQCRNGILHTESQATI